MRRHPITCAFVFLAVGGFGCDAVREAPSDPSGLGTIGTESTEPEDTERTDADGDSSSATAEESSEGPEPTGATIPKTVTISLANSGDRPLYFLWTAESRLESGDFTQSAVGHITMFDSQDRALLWYSPCSAFCSEADVEAGGCLGVRPNFPGLNLERYEVVMVCELAPNSTFPAVMQRFPVNVIGINERKQCANEAAVLNDGPWTARMPVLKSFALASTAPTSDAWAGEDGAVDRRLVGGVVWPTRCWDAVPAEVTANWATTLDPRDLANEIMFDLAQGVED